MTATPSLEKGASWNNKEDCPACGGRGVIQNLADRMGDDPEHECELCKGRGEIDAHVAKYIQGLETDRDYWRNKAAAGEVRIAILERDALRDAALPLDASRRRGSAR